MILLGLLWLALLVVELIRGLPPLLHAANIAIWALFLLDFLLRLLLAPARRTYLARNWLTALSLLVPALRAFRALRVVRLLRAGRAVRGIRLVRIIASANRSIRAVGQAMQQRHLGYVLVITAVVVLAGSAGIYAFERADAAQGEASIRTFGDALWWTTMIMTTLGTDYWPRTPEGRILCLLLALYAFAVFGYVTASLATLLIGADVRRGRLATLSSHDTNAVLQDVQKQLAALRDEIRRRGGLNP